MRRQAKTTLAVVAAVMVPVGFGAMGALTAPSTATSEGALATASSASSSAVPSSDASPSAGAARTAGPLPGAQRTQAASPPPSQAASNAPAEPQSQPQASAAPSPAAGGAGSGGLAGMGATPDDGSGEIVDAGRAPYGGDAERESGLVAAEDRRLTQVRSFTAAMRWSKQPMTFPYDVVSGDRHTLVLTERAAPYTVADLLKLAPKGFARTEPGVYLLGQHVVVQPGATLHLGGQEPTTLRMASDAAGFASIVNDGGKLEMVGTAAAPLTVTSWDRTAKAVDTHTEDGRAYVRSDGGGVVADTVTLTSLGFWSGRTGGLAVLGGDEHGAAASRDLALASGTELAKIAAEAAAKEKALTADAAAETARRAAAAAAAAKAAGQPSIPAKVEARRDAKAEAQANPAPVALDKLQPAGQVLLPDVAGQAQNTTPAPASSVVLRGLTVDDDAFGLYLSGVDGATISGSTIRNSRVDGLVLHRDVTRAAVTDLRSERNRGDGVVVARATTGITLSQVQAVQNARDGVLLSGAPLASGPNAAGSSTQANGDAKLAESLVADNGRYGVAVVGGRRVEVKDNDVQGQQVGIVVRSAASEVQVAGNTVEGAARQGIVVRDGVRSTTIAHNKVAGAPTGLYVRGSEAAVSENLVEGASTHAVTVLGPAHGVTVKGNTLTGEGPAALDVRRAEGMDSVRVELDNKIEGWSVSKPLGVAVRRVLAPLTVLWLVLAGIVVATGIRGRDRRWRKRHPYAETMPVAARQPVGPSARRTAGTGATMQPAAGGS
ncbi:MAG: right-handed parallel beta-helix repeat-containing protein [Austwickia sp.]|jgi:hypothetical protein|nr:MAG: right-handed parallel beta-helix repeat-containing protein [Austwickia sp.]